MIEEQKKPKSVSCWPWNHSWGKWEIYKVVYRSVEDNNAIVADETRQRRHCSVCNKAQDEYIRGGL